MNERAENGNTDDGVFKRAGIFIKTCRKVLHG
jgi:hypothetical protein